VTARPWIRWLGVAGLYTGLLLSQMVLPLRGVHAHPRAYLWEFQGADPLKLTSDALLNFLAFVPLGWLLGRAGLGLGASPAAIRLAVLLLCGGLSLSVETLQYFIASRYSSAIDVLTNATGGLLGAALAVLGRRRRA
jgi:glycopeptide antibiotics resistance protein